MNQQALIRQQIATLVDQYADNVMNNTFWIGVQPALSREMLEFAAQKIESYLGVNF